MYSMEFNQMKFDSLNDLFLNLLGQVWNNGSEVNSRGSKQKELLFQSFTLTNPTALDITSDARKFSKDYAVSEWMWYLSTNRSAKNIGKLAKIWSRIADENGEVESNYGSYFWPQWKWVINELVSDNDTRRATMVVNQPHHKEANVNDYPCTQYVQFLIRDKKLHMGVNMRSNDIIFGLCNDVFTFCLFQQMMLNELRLRGLDIELGEYYHHAGSLHLYEMHFSKAQQILKEDVSQNSAQTFELRGDFCWPDYQNLKAAFPMKDTNKKELQELAKLAAEELFV